VSALARTSDPVESHEAAASVGDLRPSQDAVLSALTDLMPAGGTDVELITRYRWLASLGQVPEQSESGIRSRRAELVVAGRVERSALRRRTPSGRWARVWVVAR